MNGLEYHQKDFVLDAEVDGVPVYHRTVLLQCLLTTYFYTLMLYWRIHATRSYLAVINMLINH